MVKNPDKAATFNDVDALETLVDLGKTPYHVCDAVMALAVSASMNPNLYYSCADFSVQSFKPIIVPLKIPLLENRVKGITITLHSVKNLPGMKINRVCEGPQASFISVI
jgi:hypothetical protein